jgi:hypothetical protein
MAKRSVGAFVSLMLGQLAFAAYRNYKDKRTELEGDYRTALRDSQQQHAGEQADYEKYMRSLPNLVGDGSYTLVADTSTGDRFALESFTQYLDIMQKGEPGVAALLKIDVFENPDAVEVELSGAHVAILSVADQQDLAEAIRLAGGAVTCDARLTRLKYGDTYQLLLDVKLPIEIEEN